MAGTELVDPEAAESGLSQSSSLKQCTIHSLVKFFIFFWNNHFSHKGLFGRQLSDYSSCNFILWRLKFYTEMCLNSLVFEFLPVGTELIAA